MQRLTARRSTSPTPWSSRSSAPSPPGRALKLAAGEGRHARWLASRGWHVVAVDFAEVGLRRAKQLTAGAGVSFVVVDVHPLPLPAAHFDLLLATFFHPRPVASRLRLTPAVCRIAPNRCNPAHSCAG